MQRAHRVPSPCSGRGPDLGLWPCARAGAGARPANSRPRPSHVRTSSCRPRRRTGKQAKQVSRNTQDTKERNARAWIQASFHVAFHERRVLPLQRILRFSVQGLATCRCSTAREKHDGTAAKRDPGGRAMPYDPRTRPWNSEAHPWTCLTYFRDRRLQCMTLD